MVVALVCALMACALWALPFVAPERVEASAMELTIVRYFFFGLTSALILAALRFNPVRRLGVRDWARIIGLGLAGNTLYYVLLSAGIESAGSVPVALILASLPILMIIIGNYRRKTIAWMRLAGPTALLATGVSLTVASAGESASSPAEAGITAGMVFAALAVASWLVYGIWNAEYLADHPGTNTVAWACLIGIGTLITLPGVFLADLILLSGPAALTTTLDGSLLIWGALLGIGASWIATWLWSRASVKLPSSLLGVVVVAETLFVILYDSLLNWQAPALRDWGVIGLIIAGVTWGVTLRARSARPGADLLD